MQLKEQLMQRAHHGNSYSSGTYYGCIYENDGSDGCDQILAISVVRLKILTIFGNLVLGFTGYHSIEAQLRVHRKQDKTGSEFINLILPITLHHRIEVSLRLQRKQVETGSEFINLILPVTLHHRIEVLSQMGTLPSLYWRPHWPSCPHCEGTRV